MGMNFNLYYISYLEPLLKLLAYFSFISLSYWGIRALKIYINKNSH
ncbi:hypothetical protein SDC9_92535 [bioreactor metagenome]|uniref:Uncharacterized protein n=1 Tax=bioreactor metagenome TaxID=1076179 RepID=A0A645A4S1_9ZZZZ